MRLKWRTGAWFCSVFFGVAFLLSGLAGGAEAVLDAEEASRLFSTKVYPVLESKCFPCHGEDKQKSDLDLRSLDRVLLGGESGAAVLVPGGPGESLLYTAVTWQDPDLEMPPKENDRLTAEQIGYIKQWIAAGAPWPEESARQALQEAEWAQGANADGVQVRTSGGQSEEWTYRRYKPEDLWAFQPVRRDIEVPGGPEHPVDGFVDAKLAGAGLRRAPKADRRTLIRRASYDLTGLPPAQEEVAAFVDDASPRAWENLIERLLASPRYGEQWGRHWLDVVRYADTSGYANDWERSNAWRYRDYVIRSFNSDKPYDEFILEQLAGDELAPGDPEKRVATGFLRMGPWEHTGMVRAAVSRQQYLDDVVNGVGQSFLSIPLRCAKCHDHKFDPIPTRDYYRIMACFDTTQPVEMEVPYFEDENLAGMEEGKARIAKLLSWAQADLKAIAEKEEQAARAWSAERGVEYVKRDKAKDLPEDQKPPRFIGLDYYDQGFQRLRKQDARIWGRRLERYKPMAQTVFNGPGLTQQSAKLRVPDPAKSKAKEMPKMHVYAGGSVFAPAEPVAPGALSAVPVQTGSAQPAETPPWPEKMGGRRTALAHWIADEANPLTVRSIVNRVWQYHFGKAIAQNANNFGMTGKKPTHPELLDWLAANFVDGGWSIKALHRLIMTSETYQMAVAHPDRALCAAQDPNNDLLAFFRPRRLAAEELRDSMLAASGELTLAMGGLPAFPEINIEVALQPRMLQGSLAPAYQPSRTPGERNRRSIYAYRGRGQANPLLEVFNQPNPNESCERRDSSSVTPQVFTLMNSDVATARSIAMALRVEKEAAGLEARIVRAIALALGRKAMPEETALLVAHAGEMVSYHRAHPPGPVYPPTEVTRSVVEEMSGVSFDYVERLDRYEDYVRDTQAWDVTPETRALADVCLTLFNSNEFAYVF